MYTRKMKKLIPLTFMLLAPVFVFSADQNLTPQMIIEGRAAIYQPADELLLTVGVVTEADDAQSALTKNNTLMESVIAALQQTGLTTDEYQTGRFSIQPTYTPQPRNPPPDWQAKINGYRVTNSLNIKTGKLSMAGTLIDAANKAGANSIDQISFGLKNAESKRSEAISAATANAIKDAQTLAEAANIKLGNIQRINLDNAQVPTPQMKGNMLYAARSMDVATPISSGDVEISATVSIVYEITNP
ncbi:MAG: SIMPL domain-containing protein [Chlamydiales bacterium]|nr:SIMPL domain-containing protein [Chlamydiia bacterium]MCP5507330.1 SIMPL domain-containing protein [Chlamydiales bacterium]